jgi:hypothetical protein
MLKNLSLDKTLDKSFENLNALSMVYKCLSIHMEDGFWSEKHGIPFLQE